MEKGRNALYGGTLPNYVMPRVIVPNVIVAHRSKLCWNVLSVLMSYSIIYYSSENHIWRLYLKSGFLCDYYRRQTTIVHRKRHIYEPKMIVPIRHTHFTR
jgi:hypothetical protein